MIVSPGYVAPNAPANGLTFSTVVTVQGEDCFNSGACSTSSAPGATAQATAPVNTAKPTASPIPGSVAEKQTQVSTLRSPQVDATQQSPVPCPARNGPNDEPFNYGNLSPAQLSQFHHALGLSSQNPAPPTAQSQTQALGAIIINAINFAPNPEHTAPTNAGGHNNAQIQPLAGSPGYIVSLAPSASMVVVNSVTSQLLGGESLGNAHPVVTVGSQPTTLNAIPALAVDGQTIAAGAPAVTINGTWVFLALSASRIVVDGIATLLSPGKPLIITLGSQPITASIASQYAVGGQTVTAGAAAITISGTSISLAPSADAVIVGSNTIAIPTTSGPTLPEFTFGGHAITANSVSQYIIGGQTLTPGGSPITVSRTAINLAPGASQVVVGGTTQIILQTYAPLPLLMIGSQTFTANSESQYVFGGESLITGGRAITISSTPISLAHGASDVVIGGSTEILHPSNGILPSFTIDSNTFTANSASAYIIGGQTLVPREPSITIAAPTGPITVTGASHKAYTVGGQVFTSKPTAFSIDGTPISAGGPGVTIDGTVVSLEISGDLDIGSSTILLSANPASPTVFTVGNEVFKPNPKSFSIDDPTILAGGPGVTIDGTIVRLGTSGTLDIGSSTILRSSSNVYTVGGEVFTPNPTAFSIDCTTISAGGRGVTINGTLVSLKTSGVLDIGNSSITLTSASSLSAGPRVPVQEKPIRAQARTQTRSSPVVIRIIMS